MNASDLPTLNAVLNGLATLLLLGSFWAIKFKRDEALHKKLMLAALAMSAGFLASYLVYHFQVGSVPFPGQGLARTLYFAILIPHIILAAAQVPLIVLAVVYAYQNKRRKHVKIVKFAYPIWLYVSITGVVIYVMLYQMSW